MTSYPRLCALLTELCTLEVGDDQLPLQVLINMHRAQLRVPLEQLAHVAPPSDYARASLGTHAAIKQAAAGYFTARWPELSFDLYVEQPALVDITGRIEQRFETLPDTEFLDAAGNPTSAVEELIRACLSDFRAYDPVYLLHHLTWRGAEVKLVAQVLEMELGVSPQVREAILRLAGKTSAVVVA